MYLQQSAQSHPTSGAHTFGPAELRNYFLPPPNRRIFTFILLNLFILILVVPFIVINTSFLTDVVRSVLTIGAVLIISAPLILSGMHLVFYYLRSHPTDQEYDAWVNNWTPTIQQNGLRELNLDPSEVTGQPLFVHGLIWPNSPEAEFYRKDSYPTIKQDKYGYPHSSINRFLFFYPTRHDIAIFTCDVNALSSKSYTRAQRYFYNNIVGIETFALYAGNDTMRRFELQIANGQSIGIPVFISDPNITGTVSSLNALLRDKKHGSGRGPAGL